jgi:pimeloyl-ACP methyl ester carboxylesterase
VTRPAPDAGLPAGFPPEIRNAHGERIACTWTPGADDAPAAARHRLVIIGHGLTSDRERPWSRALAEALAPHGLSSLRIAFSGNGDSEGSFLDSCITKEVDDLGAVLDAAEEAGYLCAYVGHSMGSAVGIVRAAADPRIRAFVGLAGIAHTAEFVTRMFGHLRPGDPMLDKPGCPFGETLRDDLLALGAVVDLAPSVKGPWLLVHGTADEVVPVTDSRDLAAASRGRARLTELPGVDHSFTGDGLPAMVEVVVKWLVTRIDPSSDD